jgi:hypothetical protein
MRSVRTLLLALLMCACTVAHGAHPSGISGFSKRVSGTDSRVPIAHASFADKIFFDVFIIANAGEHSLQVTIYDGTGREVYNSESRVVASGGRVGAAISCGMSLR